MTERVLKETHWAWKWKRPDKMVSCFVSDRGRSMENGFENRWKSREECVSIGRVWGAGHPVRIRVYKKSSTPPPDSSQVTALKVALDYASKRIDELEREAKSRDGIQHKDEVKAWGLVRRDGAIVMVCDDFDEARDYKRRIYSLCEVKRVLVRVEDDDG